MRISKHKLIIINASKLVAKIFSVLLLLYSLSVVYNFIVLNSSVDFGKLGIVEKIVFVLTPIFSVIVYLLLSLIFLSYTYIVEVVLGDQAMK